MKFPVIGTITAQLSSLTFPSSIFDEVARRGNRVTFHVPPPGSPAEIARTADVPTAQITVEDQNIVVDFDSEKVAIDAEFDGSIFSTGPYEQADYNADELVLRRRSGNGPDLIHVTKVGSQDEEWRRFLAREFDVMTSVTESARQYLREVPSVRLVPYEKKQVVTLYFSMTSEALADPTIREGISLALRREPLATTVFGTGSGTEHADENTDKARQLLAGRHLSLRLAVPSSMNDFVRAAAIVQSQLKPFGVDISIGEFNSVEEPRDLLIFYGFGMSAYVTGDDSNLSHYSNPAFDAAMAAGNTKEAHQILETDIPAIPLFQMTVWAAIDRRFCGGAPKDTSDFSWIADLHVCHEGETN